MAKEITRYAVGLRGNEVVFSGTYTFQSNGLPYAELQELKRQFGNKAEGSKAISFSLENDSPVNWTIYSLDDSVLGQQPSEEEKDYVAEFLRKEGIVK